MQNDGEWASEDAALSFQNSTIIDNSSMIPTGFTREYHVLSEVCASMSSGFMLLNQQRVIYSNPSALRLLRIAKNDLVSPQEFDVHNHLLSLVADPQLARAELDRVWLHPDLEYSTDLALADAAIRWLRIRSFPVHDDRGALLGRGVLFDDITLERSAVEARSETLALAAHELKTPLAIIKGCATTLLGSSARWDPAMQREMLQMIDTQSDRLHDVLNTLLDVWRLDAGAQPLRLTQVALPELFTQLMHRWQKQAPGHRFVLSLPPSVPPLMCDAMRIEQTLNHLLQNAVTYSSAGKIVSVHLETNDVELRVSVADEGIGIASEHLDRIFDRFYRVQSESEPPTGSGLGLASARSSVEAHGGRIWADSPGIGQGATFYFTLPFAPRLSATAQATTTPAITTSLPALQQKTSPLALLKQDRRVRVLLAESDARMTRYLRANLEEQRYRVQTVNHGVQFLRQLDLEEPDVILLSTRLADMSGVELLQRLREFSQAPIMMLCDDCDEDERVQMLDLGCDDLVVKPFGMKELLARVRVLLRRQNASTGNQLASQSVFSTGDLVIDHAQHLVTVRGKAVQLSRTEYNLLSVLAQNAGIVVTHELLLEKVWGPEYNRDIDFIWVYISRLRRKIEEDSRRPKYIVTVPDVGYKLVKI
jgi:DNA-binding response OmpR family regulator/signal transduction histidine kinase